ncbi:MAG: Mov34/MPN/PAD-1 family protein [Thermomicrobiales bacterium]
MSAGVFRLPASMAGEIIDHSRSEAPRECCGLIAGGNGAAEQLYRLNNLAPGTELYDIDPAQLLELEFRTLPAIGREVVAIYHSHPHSPAWPSSTDIALAGWPDAVYLICSLEYHDAPSIRAFRIMDGSVEELAIEMV